MPERLTESLIRRGKLTRAQAEEAIQRQVLYGGALDTSILELGVVGEREVSEGMALAYGLATASPAQVTAEPDPRAMRCFPEPWAKKHDLAPLILDEAGEVLSVLTPAPTDTYLLTRLGDLLEVTLRPVLAPEFRVHQRLALLYGVEPPERFRALIDPRPSASRAPLPSSSARDVPPLSFGEAITRLRDAPDRDQIVHTALRYAVRDLEFVAMFINHESRLEGWMGCGPGSDIVPRVSLPLTSESAFKVVVDTRAHYLGPLPSDALHGKFLESLGRPAPRAVLIVPIRIKSRTVALLYGENGNKTIPSRLAADLMLFTTHVQQALEALLIRRKAETLSELGHPPESIPVPSLVPSEPADEIEIEVEEPVEMFPEPSPSVAVEEATWETVDVPGLDEGDARVDSAVRTAEAALLAAAEDEEYPVGDPTAPMQALVDSATTLSDEPLPTDLAPAEDVDLRGIDEPDLPAELAPAEDVDLQGIDEPDLPAFEEDPFDNLEDGEDDAWESATPPDPTDTLAALGSASGLSQRDDDAPEPTTSVLRVGGSLFGPGAFERAVLAETEDGKALLDELDELASHLSAASEDSKRAAAEAVSTAFGEPEQGWEPVPAESWDELGTPEWAKDVTPGARQDGEVQAMRDSLSEDTTVPDLSAEAWIRASSEIVRPRPLPPEVMERASLPAEAPVPLTRITIGKRATSGPGWAEPGRSERAADMPAEGKDAMVIEPSTSSEEPVPLTRRSSGILRADPLPNDGEVSSFIAEDDAQSDLLSSLVSAMEDELDDSIEQLAHGQNGKYEDGADDTFDLNDGEPDFSIGVEIDDTGRVVPVGAVTAPTRAPDPWSDAEARMREESKRLVERLVGPDPRARDAAADLLSEHGAAILPALMARFPGTLEIDPFAAGSIPPPFGRCSALLSVLDRLGRDAHPYVVKHLDAPEPSHRFFAVYFYGAVYVPEAIPRLIQRLHDEEPRISLLAARTLFSYREHPDFALVLDHLHGRLNATSIGARRHATYLIGLFRDVTAIPQLIEILDRRERTVTDVTEDALSEITKQRFAGNVKKWRAWWSKNQGRSRIEWLIEGLGSKDADLRRSSADELRAVTGLDLGYDENAGRREREDARRRWQQWWDEQNRRASASRT